LILKREEVIEMSDIVIPLSDGEWNIVLNALYYKTTDKQNSKKAQQDYVELYRKLMTIKFGEGASTI
jgi:hypothetical protein